MLNNGWFACDGISDKAAINLQFEQRSVYHVQSGPQGKGWGQGRHPPENLAIWGTVEKGAINPPGPTLNRRH